VLWRERRVARSQKRFFVEKLHKWQRSKKIPPGSRVPSVDRTRRSRRGLAFRVDRLGFKKDRENRETLLIGPGNQD
jgi:hypothetical protein